MTENEQSEIAQKVRQMRENMPALLEYTALQARLTFAKYIALVEAGFTAEQAVEICKV